MKQCQWNCVQGYCLSWDAKHNENQCSYCKAESNEEKA